MDGLVMGLDWERGRRERERDLPRRDRIDGRIGCFVTFEILKLLGLQGRRQKVALGFVWSSFFFLEAVCKMWL